MNYILNLLDINKLMGRLFTFKINWMKLGHLDYLYIYIWGGIFNCKKIIKNAVGEA